MHKIKRLIEKKKVITILLLGLVSGFLGFMFLAFINVMVANMFAVREGLNVNYLILYLILLVAYIWSIRSLSAIMIEFSQNFFWRIRMDVIEIILKANYSQLNKMREKVHSALTHDVGVLAGASLMLIQFISSSVISISCLVYIAILSAPLFWLTILTIFSGVVVYLIRSKSASALFRRTRDLENSFMKHFLDILSGFKQIHLDPKKGTAIFEDKIRDVAKDSYKNNIFANVSFLNNQITGQVFFYILVGFVLLFYYKIPDIPTAHLVSYVFILLYLLNSIQSVMNIIPMVVRAKISAVRLTKLRVELEERDYVNVVSNIEITREDFQYIQLSNVGFKYDSDEQFEIGPMNFSIKTGDVIFIYGGNGSGKTTFINLLLGLISTSSGQIEFNGSILNDSNYGHFRAHFAVVLSDFYLFDEFYGIENIDFEKAMEYLIVFELEGKVIITEKGFSTTDLSTGQRKRLALIAALLENKPILVLDEWAADQDPFFRKKFYMDIIPRLVEEGITVIAVTHDDAYYQIAERLYKMEHGKLMEQFFEKTKIYYGND